MARLLILLAAALFSTGGAAIKATALGAWPIAGLRSIVAALFLAAVYPKAVKNISRGTLAVGLAYAGTLLLYVQANKLTTAANAIFLQSTAPLYLLLLAPWLIKERIHRRDLPLMLAIVVGMTLFFVGNEPAQQTAPNPLLGNVLGACAGVGWALTILGLRWLAAGGGDVVSSVIAGNLIAFVISLPFFGGLPELGRGDVLLIGYLGVIQIGLAYVFITKGMRDVPAFEASLLILLEPVLNPIWAWLVHSEKMSRLAIVGAALILLATIGHAWITSRRSKA